VEGFRSAPVIDANGVKSIIEKFRDKYGGEGCDEILLEIRCSGRGCAVLMKANATER